MKKRIKKWYDNLSQSKQEIIISLLNSVFNALPLSILIYLVMGLWYPYTLIRYIFTYICIAIFLPYFEHYYKWLRLNWREEQ